MARAHKLTALAVDRLAKKPGRHGDGAGLYLEVQSPTARHWAFRFMLHGKARQMGLGPYPDVTLAEARQKAEEARRVKAAGLDPLEAKRAAKAQTAQDAARAMTFQTCAAEYIATLAAGWRNAKHKAQWSATLEQYAYPVIGTRPVAAVDVEAVLAVLQPLWATKTTTANRLRGRIEAVLDYAAAMKRRSGDNPARWRGHLAKLLPKRSSVHTVRHHPALPYAEIGPFMARLAAQDGLGALALQFTILTAARTGEAIAARWSEVDMKAGVWTIPAERMKARREHRVPLSKAALAVLERAAAHKLDKQDWVFPGRRDKPLSNMAMLATLHRMERDDLTVHGFRSTFRDWTAEATGFPREVAEAALAHTLEDKVEAAYRRGDLFSKRREMMDAWGNYATGTGTGNVLRLARRK
jgi:integrase